MPFIFVLLSLLFLACEPAEKNLEFEFLLDATAAGAIVRVDSDAVASINGEAQGIVPIGVNKLAVTTCPPAWTGLDPGTYWWFCEMNETKGHAIAPAAANPIVDDINIYEESPSDDYPTDMTFRIFFSQKPEHYPNWCATNVNHLALRGCFAALGAGWNNARVDWCSVGNHPERCVQD